MKMRNQGFTLLELMIVVAIIGILAGALFPSMTRYFGRARDANRVSDLNKLGKALEAYKIDENVYPNAMHHRFYNPTGTEASCISNAPNWDCWGGPSESGSLNESGMLVSKRLIPKNYIDTIPEDQKITGGDRGDACSRPSASSVYSYASTDTSIGFVLATRLEFPPDISKPTYYSGIALGCTQAANWAIIINNGGYPLSSGAVGR